MEPILSEGETISPSHTNDVFSVKRRKQLVKDLLRVLRALRRTTDFNAIAASGHSGLVVASVLAFKLDVSLLAVRRDRNETDNDGSACNGHFFLNEPTRYIVIDDLIDSGKTVSRIFRAIAEEAPEDRMVLVNGAYIRRKIPAPVPVGVLLYNDVVHANLVAPSRIRQGRWEGHYSVPVWALDDGQLEGYGGVKTTLLRGTKLFRHLAKTKKRA